MHYYKRDIGKYLIKAGRLSMLQHGAYTLLMDSCYDRERFPTHDEALEWAWASNPDEICAVEFVLSKFFSLENGVFIQKEIQDDLLKYKDNSAINKQIAIERETNRRELRTNREQIVHEAPRSEHEPPPNYELRTKNLNSKTFNALHYLISFSVDEQIANDWLQVRKLKKLATTKTAIDSIFKEMEKSNLSPNNGLKICCENGWAGFKLNWLDNLPKQINGSIMEGVL